MSIEAVRRVRRVIVSQMTALGRGFVCQQLLCGFCDCE